MRDAIPSEFGSTWTAFAREWSGSALAAGPSDVSKALWALKSHLPDEVERHVTDSARGACIAAPLVELGTLLAECESTQGFTGVVNRLKQGERSAYAELVVAASLARLGFRPWFAPEFGARVLDVACYVDEAEPIYFEVVAPERSDASIAQRKVIDDLTKEIRGSVSECRVEIELFRIPDADGMGAVVRAVKLAPSSSWCRVGSFARFRRIDSGEPLPPAFDGGMQIIIGGDKTTQSSSTGVIARWESMDARAKRVFNDEYHHFSDRVRNVLVVDVCGATDGMKSWPGEMARLLQPTRNRKVGAVLFFEQGVLGPPEATRRRWRVLTNSHARHQIPESVLAGFESLDESSFHGMSRAERLVG